MKKTEWGYWGSPNFDFFLDFVSQFSRQLLHLKISARPNKFLDAAIHRFDGGNKQKEGMVRSSTVKRGVFLGSR